jgi:hypothetical protein
VSRGESGVRLDRFAVTPKRFCGVAGGFRGNAAVHKRLRQPAVSTGRQYIRRGTPEQISDRETHERVAVLSFDRNTFRAPTGTGRVFVAGRFDDRAAQTYITVVNNEILTGSRRPLRSVESDAPA